MLADFSFCLGRLEPLDETRITAIFVSKNPYLPLRQQSKPFSEKCTEETNKTLKYPVFHVTFEGLITFVFKDEEEKGNIARHLAVAG